MAARPLTLDEAKVAICDPKTPYAAQVEAAMILTSDAAATADDLNRCHALGGLPAELAQARVTDARKLKRSFSAA